MEAVSPVCLLMHLDTGLVVAQNGVNFSITISGIGESGLLLFNI
jgi:hypothetical protein